MLVKALGSSITNLKFHYSFQNFLLQMNCKKNSHGKEQKAKNAKRDETTQTPTPTYLNGPTTHITEPKLYP